MRKFSFCGIFATLFVTTTIILLASCSQDDDYYESDMYTLAEMETRLGDPEQGGGIVIPLSEGFFTEEIQWKKTHPDGVVTDSVAVTCKVKLRVVYDPDNVLNGVFYDGLVNDTVFDARINGSCNKVQNSIHYWAILTAKYIMKSDTLPDETLNVRGIVERYVSPTLFQTIHQ